MTRLLHRPQRDEALIPVATAKPGATATARPPLPLGAPARSVAVLAELRATDAADAVADAVEQASHARRMAIAPLTALLNTPIPHADWSAWLADDWDHLADRYAVLDDATAREFAAFRAAFEYAPYVLTAPLLSELAELTTVQLPDWRRALTTAAEDELAVYDAAEVKSDSHDARAEIFADLMFDESEA